jgi:predicted nucleic acid-binding protein
MKKLELVTDPAPMAPKANIPPDLYTVREIIGAVCEVLKREQDATAQDAQRMIDAVNKTRETVNKELDTLIEALRGTMHERMVSVETVIGGPG